MGVLLIDHIHQDRPLLQCDQYPGGDGLVAAAGADTGIDIAGLYLGGQDFRSIQVLMERLIAALDRFHAECRMQVAAEGIFVAVRSGLYTFRNRQFLCLLGNVAGLLYQRAARQK